MIRRARSAVAAALLVYAPLTLVSARAFIPSTASLNFAVRQAGATTYPQCDGAGKSHIESLMGACGGCLSGGCPDGCCVEQPSSNQYVVCQVPAPGGAGCCIRVMGNGVVEVAASETVTAQGKKAEGTCMPSNAGTPSQCPAQTCAVAGSPQQQEIDCPGGIVVPSPNDVYSSPPQCVGGAAPAAAAAPVAATTAAPAAAPAAAPGTAAPGTVTPGTSAPVAAAAATAAAAAAAAPAAPVAGVVPAGCTKTYPGFRCMGEPGFPEVKWRGGCCVGTCAKDPSKGWGSWCPELGATASNADATPAAVTEAPAAATAAAPVEAVTVAAPQATAPPPVVTTGPPVGVVSTGEQPVVVVGAAAEPAAATEAPTTTSAAPPVGVVATAAEATTAAPAVVVAAPAAEEEKETTTTTVAAPVVVVAATEPQVKEDGEKTSVTDAEASANVGSADGGSKCFHGSGLVELKGGAMKRISDVSVGDVVKVGSAVYSEVYMFSHKNELEKSSFVNVTTQSGHEILVTPGHYLWSAEGLVDSAEISVGDMVLLGDGGASAVAAVSRVRGVGLYNPQTLQGDIVVNDVKASTFTTALPVSLARVLLAPLQAAYCVTGISVQALESGKIAAALMGMRGWGVELVSRL